MSDTTRAPLTVFYDSDCGVCQRTVDWCTGRDRDRALTFVGHLFGPGAEAQALPPGYDLDRLAAERQDTIIVWDRVRDRVFVKARGMGVILSRLPRWRLLSPILTLPVLRWFADRFYEVFAARRHKVSAAMGMTECKLPDSKPVD
jgi:predicted DCC family thiol-disulfide oxidoreductase YuxK